MRRPRKAIGKKSERPTHEEIAARAYERFERRGRLHGYDLEDWLAAERETLSERLTAEAVENTVARAPTPRVPRLQRSQSPEPRK